MFEPKRRGRPSCNKQCCSDKAKEILNELYSKGFSSREIADIIGVSHEHIIQRFHKLGIKTRKRGRYRKRSDKIKKGKYLLNISNKELLSKPIKELAFKYLFDIGGEKSHE